MKKEKQKGFTLVEITIVLIVIGLLLAGVLRGQQLMNSARVRNLADQSSGIQVAYYNFFDRFRNLPGDMTCTAATTAVGIGVSPSGTACTINVGGDANGRIDSVTEAAAVWAHLSVAGFLTGIYDGLVADDSASPAAATYAATVSNNGVPANAFQGAIMLAHSHDYVKGNARDSFVRLTYSFGGKVPAALLRDLDQKLDDGIAGSGLIRSASEATDAAVAQGTFGAVSDYTAGDDDCLDDADPAQWNVDSANQTCNAIFLY